MSKLSVEEKHRLYESSVQCHENDIIFIGKEYESVFGKRAKILREDFGGTGALACDWVKLGLDYQAYAVDLDSEPIGYGLKHHYPKLNDEQKTRMNYVEGNVLSSYEFKSDITVAFNFSYFIFKERKILLEYFKKVHEGLSDNGAFFLDLFGGTEGCQELVEETEHEDHSYFWDCEKYNPITSEVLYYIHFKTKDGVKHEKVFTYDWRMWGLQELKDVLIDAGFSKVNTFWEGDDDDGTGDGEFEIVSESENCESWVTYLCAIK